MIRRPPRSTLDRSSAASDVYKRQAEFLGGDLKPLQRSDLSAYHDLVKAYDTLWRYTRRDSPIDLLTAVQNLLAKKSSKEDLLRRLTNDFLAAEKKSKSSAASSEDFYQNFRWSLKK